MLSLPDTVADPAVYIISGAISIEAVFSQKGLVIVREHIQVRRDYSGKTTS